MLNISILDKTNLNCISHIVRVRVMRNDFMRILSAIMINVTIKSLI